MKKQVVHVSVLQSSKVMAVLYLVLSLPFVLLMALTAPFTGAEGVSIAMLIFAPILYAIFGFIFTAIGAWIYNLVAARIGGFEFTTTEASN